MNMLGFIHCANFNHKDVLYLCDRMVVPIITYATDIHVIWGYKPVYNTEKIHMKFCRKLKLKDYSYLWGAW